MILPDFVLQNFERFYTPHDIEEEKDGLAILPKGTKFILNLEEDPEEYHGLLMTLLAEVIEKLSPPYYIASYCFTLYKNILDGAEVKVFYVSEDMREVVEVTEEDSPVWDFIPWLYFETQEDINLDQTFAYEGSNLVTEKGKTIEEIIAYEKSLSNIPEVFKED